MFYHDMRLARWSSGDRRRCPHLCRRVANPERFADHHDYRRHRRAAGASYCTPRQEKWPARAETPAGGDRVHGNLSFPESDPVRPVRVAVDPVSL
jgi:hypothetical protein